MRRLGDVRRGVLLVAAAAVSLLLVLVLAVPVTRDGLAGAWCSLTGSGCAPGGRPPGEEPGSKDDWRVAMDPVEAATWGHYLALGDSYSSGDGAGSYLPGTTGEDGCFRSADAYPSRASEAFDFAGGFAFVACSKHKGSQLLDEAGAEDAQLDAIGEYTSLVSLGIGGNDLGFTPVLRTCMVRVPLVSGGVCQGQEEDIDRRMRTFDDTLEEIIAEVRDRAPDARLLLVGYPRLFPKEPSGMYYTLTVEDQTWLNGKVRAFNDRLRTAAREADEKIAEEGDVGSVEFVDVYTALAGHEVSAEDAWLNGVVLQDLTDGIQVHRSSFHPTAAGQRAFADRVGERIEEGPGRELYVARDTVDAAGPEVLARDLD
ncbi:SGNH/GDSL hydrolase family protein [Nocardiopsis sp. RSe5-2]|uniref:SGNH/GDSL hydrolase family protein n=1 Tax=Nocardiopsis endophytica TaxID=3018445 RepID=A0ABT4U973_9ACTN|nr:SGNH/GDSL hydrolase family protein [Nocardiopsis endophytica]MDA2813503.1 SGNH/GDSL hydrolase family protein [Nocardiopsis endophytica]